MPVINYYTVNGEIIAEQTLGDSRVDYLTDALGSIVGTINQALSIQGTARYKPYGADLAINSYIPAFGYEGGFGYRRTLRPHADIYVRARTLGSVEGRWTTVDPLWPKTRPFAYVRSRPTAWVDPSGLQVMPRLSPGPGTINGSGISGGYNYGSYCGPNVQQNPAWGVTPQDCIDACCQKHDRCLEAQYGAGLSSGSAHSCCDLDLVQCVAEMLGSGCCSNSPTPYGCLYAGETIYIVFPFLAEGNPNTYSAQNCVPPNLWLRYSRINWGSPYAIHPLDKHVASPFGCSGNTPSGGDDDSPAPPLTIGPSKNLP